MFINYEDASMGSRDEEEQRPLTTADIRALLDELMEEQDARQKEEIKEMQGEIKEMQGEIKEMQEEIKLQDARHKEEMRALLDEQEERINAETDRRFKDLERALTSSSRPQDGDNDNFTHNQRSYSQLVPNRPRRGNSARFSLLMFRMGKSDRTNDDNDEGDNDDGGSPRSQGLEEDTFSLMMTNRPFREIPHFHPTLVKIIFVVGLLGIIIFFADVFLSLEDSLLALNPALGWSLFATSWIMMLGPLSRPWLFSMFTFAVLQMFLGLMIVVDQTLVQSDILGCLYHGETCVPFNVPIGAWKPFTIVQYLTIFFAIVTQNDVFTSIQTLSKLWNADNVPWDEVIGQKGNRTWRFWACRILLPNLLKFLQAVMTLFVTLIVIIQSTGIVPMLKDFTALFVLSEADNIMFNGADLGYFGEDLAKKTEEVKAVTWMIREEEREEEQDVNEGEEKKCHRRWCNCSIGSCVFITLWMVMSGTLTYLVAGQYNGRYMKMKYPQCNVLSTYRIGNEFCHDFPPYYTAECGWDGGDCPVPTVVKGYINCTVPYPNKIGNGVCEDYPPYNTEDCGFDGGDCLYDKVVVDGYPDCSVRRPEWIGNGRCFDFAPYYTPECGYDGGDCNPPQ